LGGGLAAMLGTLPDIVEPAHDPNHRQFFHSLVFAAILGYLAYRLYRWKPEEPWQQAARMLGLIMIGAYLVHLSMDAMTSKSLPILGKL
jgi:inner membrane protein